MGSGSLRTSAAAAGQRPGGGCAGRKSCRKRKNRGPGSD